MSIEQIMEGQTLSQEAKLKITEAFNTAVDAKVETLLVGKIAEATEKLEEDNKLVIENKLKELEAANEQYVKENIVDVVDNGS
jgi:predicted ribosome quality control (RQC) complex YloA/Tae2 family protein